MFVGAVATKIRTAGGKLSTPSDIAGDASNVRRAAGTVIRMGMNAGGVTVAHGSGAPAPAPLLQLPLPKTECARAQTSLGTKRGLALPTQSSAA